ncbi:MAG: OsmC family protein [Flavobacteriaceae bacterium]|nr:OsmC family protein [Flavobacteriaceae bacterium]
MKVYINRLNDEFLFEAEGQHKKKVLIDSSAPETVQGSSPMELLLMAVGSCNAIDIVSILKKQRQSIHSYKVEVEGERKEVKQARPFSDIHVTVILEGEIDPAKAKRAAQLSFEKYCSVSMTMDNCVNITYDVVLNDHKI